jgi:DNA-binding transcriptional regulator PaaX
MKARRKKLKSKSFGELVQKLWQPTPEEFEPKVTTQQKKSVAKDKRIQKR